jgi:competence protein ComEA
MDLRARQRLGAVVVVVIAAVLYLFRAHAPTGDPLWKRFHPNADLRSGGTIVELAGVDCGQGIYFLPPKATVRELLDIAGVADRERLGVADQERSLRSGITVKMEERPGDGQVIRFGRMANATRFALDMPMGLNRATLQDLMFVPGIGERTAEAILEARQEIGLFRNLDDLLEVRGIGPKKLETFSRYFFIDAGR